MQLPLAILGQSVQDKTLYQKMLVCSSTTDDRLSHVKMQPWRVVGPEAELVRKLKEIDLADEAGGRWMGIYCHDICGS